MSHLNSIENELIVFTKQTVDKFMKSDYPAELMALYTFYYYTAKWQKTNQPKCTTSYVANGLKWGDGKVRKIKKLLLELGLIEDVQVKDEGGKIVGHYIKLVYLFKQETIKEEQKPPLQKTTGWFKPQGGSNHRVDSEGTNALSSSNRNALSSSNRNALSSSNRNALTKDNHSCNTTNNVSHKKTLSYIKEKNIYKKEISEIINYLNNKLDSNYKPTTGITKSLIIDRLNDNFTVDNFKTVIDSKYKDWHGTDFEKYLRPETLFSNKFEGYLNAKVKDKPKPYWLRG